MYRIIRPILFLFDPECAHKLTLFVLKYFSRFLFVGKIKNKPVQCLGLTFANPLGIAAGFDKNGEAIDGLFRMGFGFVEVGTVTPKPQTGNSKPRLFRLPKAKALINRMGFNNFGVDNLIGNIKRRRLSGILIVNVGKNAVTPIENAADDYLIGIEKAYPYADLITINISSPNTARLRELQQHGQLEKLLSSCVKCRDALQEKASRRVPLLVKITIDLSDRQQRFIADFVPSIGIDGIILSNTSINRDAVKELPHADEKGGLSGQPLLEKVLPAIRRLRAQLPAEYPIIGIGGISSADDAKAMLDAGANLIQLYTGLVYRGPGLVREIVDSV